MIKKTRLRFLYAIIIILFLLFLGVTLSVLLTTMQTEKNDVRNILYDTLQTPESQENIGDTFIGTRKIFIILDANKNEIKSFYDRNYYSRTRVLNLIEATLKKDFSTISYFESVAVLAVRQLNQRIYIVATDRQIEREVIRNNTLILVSFELLGFSILGLLAWFLSGYMIKPLIEANQKQVQFISDASHELKTPLSVINSCAEALKVDPKEIKWIDYIQDQINHADQLIKGLLHLTTLEEEIPLQNENINLSEIVQLSVSSFEALIFEQNKQLELDIEEDILIEADYVKIKQLIQIFLDNALKYSDENGLIKVTLHQSKNIVLTFYNTGNKVKNENLNMLFERFYRLDEARSKSGSYGLGLSIAKKICELHHYRLEVSGEYQQYIKFVITI